MISCILTTSAALHFSADFHVQPKAWSRQAGLGSWVLGVV